MISLKRFELDKDVPFPGHHSARAGWSDDDQVFRAWLDPRRACLVVANVDRTGRIVAHSCYPTHLLRRYMLAGDAAATLEHEITEHLVPPAHKSKDK